MAGQRPPKAAKHSTGISGELAKEVTEQYSGDEPEHKTNRKSHSQNESEPVSDTNRNLPYDEVAIDFPLVTTIVIVYYAK